MCDHLVSYNPANLGAFQAPMTIKESSDEVSPTAVASGALAAVPRQKRSLTDYFALAIATCGVGYFPIAPGTLGSLLGLAFYVLLHAYWFPHSEIPPGVFARSYILVQLAIIGAVTAVGIWAASRTESVLRTKDPGKVVIDEVAGQLIALLVLPARLWRASDAAALLAAFLLFRFFDIVKPYPARKLESLRGGLGIMADDLVAGVYAAIVVAVIQAFDVFRSFN